ncbi:ABC transporter ATPase [Paracrocinitomix mangrovi]|uniref:ABC transporter ATPase n=1 Tax=Paracrocinitomix mangrovi TaxID=2862509 RepID=UPI001C8F03F7|nr:ABC transporter ATPase [Paracrocinitomix mangrovi]UKN01257.1 ABC transporter ATPase [Paracrocinitomix mangrovi]
MDLPKHARTWIFQSNRKLNQEEVEYLNKELGAFVKEWAAHGNDLYGQFEVIYDLFILIAVDENRAPASGCSIDTLNRKIQELGDKLNVNFFDRLQIAYEATDTSIHIASMEQFKQKLSAGELNENTVVYNNLVANIDEFEDNWRTTVANSWHKNLMSLI